MAEIRASTTGDFAPEIYRQPLRTSRPSRLRDGERPLDERATGGSTLFLRVVERGTGQPLSTHGYLWRLGVPAGDDWTRGDELQTPVEIQTTGVLVEGLPSGRYRLECAARPRDGDDPPEFFLSDGTTELTLELDLPEEHPVSVRVFRFDGSEVREADVWVGGVERSRGGSTGAPSWAHARAPAELERKRRGRGGWRNLRSGGHHVGPFTASVAESRGFSLGLVPARGHELRHARSAEVRKEGLSHVRVRACLEDDAETTYIAPAVELARLAGHVTLPDGRSVLQSEARVWARCFAAVFTDGDAEDAWRDVPIIVTVMAAGCKTLRFEWSVREPHVTPVTLEEE